MQSLSVFTEIVGSMAPFFACSYENCTNFLLLVQDSLNRRAGLTAIASWVPVLESLEETSVAKLVFMLGHVAHVAELMIHMHHTCTNGNPTTAPALQMLRHSQSAARQ